MKSIIFMSIFCLILGQVALAQLQAPVEGDHSLLIFDPPTQTYSIVDLDNDNLILAPPHSGPARPPVHPAPPPRRPPSPRPAPRPAPHPAPHPNPPHPRPNPHPGHGGNQGGNHRYPSGWRQYPGWHDDWRRNHNYHPRWWHEGIAFPVFVWINVEPGYWQCTAFNGDMRAYSQQAPDEDQAAYGALYNCGGYNYEQFGCYIPNGYCQPR